MFGCFFSAAAVVDSNFKVSPSKTANEVAEANKSVSFFFFFFWDTTICGVHHQEEEVFFHWLTVLMLVYCLSLCFNSGWMLAQSSWWLGSHKNFFAICIYSVCSFIQGDTHTHTQWTRLFGGYHNCLLIIHVINNDLLLSLSLSISLASVDCLSCEYLSACLPVYTFFLSKSYYYSWANGYLLQSERAS